MKKRKRIAKFLARKPCLYEPKWCIRVFRVRNGDGSDLVQILPLEHNPTSQVGKYSTGPLCIRQRFAHYHFIQKSSNCLVGGNADTRTFNCFPRFILYASSALCAMRYMELNPLNGYME